MCGRRKQGKRTAIRARWMDGVKETTQLGLPDLCEVKGRRMSGGSHKMSVMTRYKIH